MNELTEERKLNVYKPHAMTDDLHKKGKAAKHDTLVTSFDLQHVMPVPKLTSSTSLIKESYAFIISISMIVVM
jgi:hypothetical protein